MSRGVLRLATQRVYFVIDMANAIRIVEALSVSQPARLLSLNLGQRNRLNCAEMRLSGIGVALCE